MRKLLMLVSVFACLSPLQTLAQEKPAGHPKLPPGMSFQQLSTFDSVLLLTEAAAHITHARIVRIHQGMTLQQAAIKDLILQEILNMPSVMFVQPTRQAREEMVLNGSDLSLNGIHLAHTRYPAIDGRGRTVSVKENRPDTMDIDFHQRFLSTPQQSNTLSAHATAMTTLIGGAGNTYYTGKGAAFRSRLTSASFQSLLPESDNYYRNLQIGVQNHSYGTTVENYYGADSWAYDASVMSTDSLLHVFSAGNAGTTTSTTGLYAGITALANITGSFKQSKNSISVAATDSFNAVALLSSKGPAYDGRIKPELVAYGQDGSSGAAALVSGSALLLQQVYQQQHGHAPPAALVKAVLINSADDLLTPGPDFISGFGSLNTEKAVRQMLQQQYVSGSVAQGGVQTFPLTISPAAQCKITLVWTDLPASAGTAKALVNDLDLEVVDLNTNTTHYPLVPHHVAHPDSLVRPATARRDTLNNVEQVIISMPAGNYLVRVIGSKVQGQQSFAVVYHTDAADAITFTYPTRNNHFFPAAANIARWKTAPGMDGTTTLQISYGNNHWETVSNNVALTASWFRIPVKDTVARAQLRLQNGSQWVYSDTFMISPRPELRVGFNCTDSFQLNWKKIPGADGYQVFALTDTFLQVVRTTPDTFITLPTGNVYHYAVAPRVGNHRGLRSFALHYQMQGVGCFINNFLADVFDDTTVLLSAVVGSPDVISSVRFQRLYPLTDIATQPSGVAQYQAVDQHLKPGIYYYRVRITLHSGAIHYSDTLAVRIFQNKRVIIYPNPVGGQRRITIHSYDHENSFFELLDASGRLLMRQRITAETQQLQLPLLPAGLYLYRIVQPGHPRLGGKLLLQ